MAELSGHLTDLFAETFVAAYNQAHGTSYVNPPDTEPEGGGEAWDFRWRSPQRGLPDLLVQHTRAGAVAKTERVHPQRVGSLLKKLEAVLKAQGLRGILVWLEVEPHHAFDVNALCPMITERATALSRGESVEIVRYRPHAPPGSLPGIEIFKINETSNPAVNATLDPLGWYEDPVWRLCEALEAKCRKIGRAATDVVLAVHFDIAGYDEEDLPELAAALSRAQICFREVWAVRLGDTARADLLRAR